MAIYSAVERALGAKGAAKGTLRIVGTSPDVAGQGIEFRSAHTLQDAAKVVQSSLGSAEMVVFSAGYKDMDDLAGAASGAAALSAAVKKASSQRGLFVSVRTAPSFDLCGVCFCMLQYTHPPLPLPLPLPLRLSRGRPPPPTRPQPPREQ